MTNNVADTIDARWVAFDDAFGCDVESLWDDTDAGRVACDSDSDAFDSDSDRDCYEDNSLEVYSSMFRLKTAPTMERRKEWKLRRQDDPRKLVLEKGFGWGMAWPYHDREVLQAKLAESVYVDEDFEVPELEDLPHLNWGPKALKMEIEREKMWTRQRENGRMTTSQMDDEETEVDAEVESWIERDFMGLD